MNRNSHAASIRTKANDSRIRAGRFAPQFPNRQFQPSRKTMTQPAPPAAPAAPATPANASEMTPEQYAKARAEIRRGNLPSYQSTAQGGK